MTEGAAPLPPLRVAIVDDETPARNRLRDVLADCALKLPLEIAGEATNGVETLYVAAFDNPLLASAVLTFLLAVALVASGALRAWVGFSHRPEQGWGWIVAAGAISVLAGLIIAMGWPVNSVWVLGLFLAIDLIFQGWTFIAVGLALKK